MRFIYLFVFLLSFSSFAQIELSNLFSNNMVLQQSSDVGIWGTVIKGKEIIINPSWSNQKFITKVKNDGSWHLKIKTPKAGGPYSIVILCDGDIKILENILIGEVWVASGQSNMEMTLSGSNREPVIGSIDLIAKSKNSNIRLYTVKNSSNLTPSNYLEGNWSVANPSSVADFSAVAYSFANFLNEILDIPIGIINSSWGGSPAEAWTDKKSLDDNFKKSEIKNNHKDNAVHHNPSGLFNGMIAPLIPFKIKGVIWYQGESNTGRASSYTKLMNTMIKGWRNQWGQGDFPFYFVQIAPNGSMGNGDGTSQAFLREAQLKTMLSLKNTGMAVTLDVGSKITNHPQEKIIVGKRLAYWALAKNYGFDTLPFSGPVYESIEIKKDKVYVNFKYAQNGVTSYGKQLTGFEIAGKNKVFFEADATINPHWSAGWQERSVLILKSSRVTNPLYIRYGWKNYIQGNLYNVEGLPASSFRSYDFD